MLLVDRQTIPASLREKSAARLKLRVRVGGQILELAEGKTTIGSSPRCNLRLDGPGVEPMHCLVFDGPEGLRVRRWAADTRLNGERVDDAALEAGDCLSVGGVELELVGPVATVKVPDARLPEVELPELMERLIAEEQADEARDDVATDVEEAAEEEALSSTEVVEVPHGWALVETAADDVDAATYDVETTDCEVAVSPEPLEVISRLEVDDIGYFHAGRSEDIDGSVTDELSGDERAPSDLMRADDAVELVFRELQAACTVARGRNRKMLAALRSLRAEKQDLVRQLENGGGSDKFDAECAGWEAVRQNAEQDEQGLLLELKELRRELGEWESRLADHTRQMADLQQELAVARAATSTFAGDRPSTIVRDDNVVESAALLSIEADAVRSTTEFTSTQSEAWEPLPVDATEDRAAVDVFAAAIDQFRAEDVHAGLLREANDPEESDVKTDLGIATVEPWDLPSAFGEKKADWAEPAEPSAQISEATAAGNISSDAAWESPVERQVDWAASDALSKRHDDNVVQELSGNAAFTDDSHDENPFGNVMNRRAMLPEQAAGQSETPADAVAGNEDLSPFAEFSIWKQGASSEQSSLNDVSTPPSEATDAEGNSAWGSGSFRDFASSDDANFEKTGEGSVSEDAVNPWAVAAEKASAAPELVEAAPEVDSPAATSQPSSFIERYSHLFADEKEPAAADKVEIPVAQPAKLSPVPGSVTTAAPPAAAPGGDNEESIEQYMAKLMKRVRGEGPVAATSAAKPAVAPAEDEKQVVPSASPSPEAVAQAEETNSNVEVVTSEEEHPEVAVNWDVFTRRAATAPATDLGALRALANATARQDISHYELKKHRRDARTKVIVSVLAGMTSLWLMLESPNWRDTQFITACISLVVAAYWAGEAFREMIKSMRAAHNAPRVSDTDETLLPIDVH